MDKDREDLFADSTVEVEETADVACGGQVQRKDPPDASDRRQEGAFDFRV